MGKKFLSDLILEAQQCDKIIDKGTETYCCKLDVGCIDRTIATPIDEQPAWQIRRIKEETIDGATVTTIQYPSGSRDFKFKVSEATYYTYEYAI